MADAPKIIGIDLGTTNSLVGVFQDGEAVLIPNVHGDVLTPSVVGLADDGSVLTGAPARERLITHPQRTVAVFKRYMGTERLIKLGEQNFRAEDLSAFVLKSLKADAEAYLGADIERAVITVPAYFRDAQRKATRIAAELAGLKVERLLNEPTAAALAYGVHTSESERKLLVFDLGGGTFDVSVLDYFDGVMEVRASAGDNRLGGEDFGEALLEYFLEKRGKELGLPEQPEGELAAVLTKQMENARRALSDAKKTVLKFRLPEANGGAEVEWELSRANFEEASRPLLDRLREPLERALRDARIAAKELDEVILIGGATRMPMVREMTARIFARFPSHHIHPDQAVGLGAAIQAGLKSKDAALKEMVLTDVAPYSLGVEVVERVDVEAMLENDEAARRRYRDGLFQPVIERNTIIPASRMRSFSTVEKNQPLIEINVFQGESRYVNENVRLGRLELPVPPNDAGAESVDVRFTYDVNGLLEVEAKVGSTGVTESIVIEENPGVLSAAEIAERLQKLAQLKVHPREEDRHVALIERAKRIYEESLGDKREYVGRLLVFFQETLERQDPAEIQDAHQSFRERLNELDENPFL